MTQTPTDWVPRDPETLEEAIAENNQLRRLLGALAAHGPTVLELARAANIIGARRHDGTLHAYACEISNARRFMKQTRRERFPKHRRIVARSTNSSKEGQG